MSNKVRTHLIPTEVTLNSRVKRSIQCFDTRPCKRMTCHECQGVRRRHFIASAVEFAVKHQISIHCTVSLLNPGDEDPWQRLSRFTPQFSRAVAGKIGKYIRCLGIGSQKRTPHIHYLIQPTSLAPVRKAAKQLLPGQVVVTHRPKATYDTAGLMGYFFDQNFLPAFLDPERPRRIRILSGSRGILYGYPSCKRASRAITVVTDEQVQ